MRTPSRLLALTALLALAMAACGEDAPVAEDPPPPESAEEPADPPADEPAAGEPGVVAVGSTDLGEVLVDGDGMTLYMFEPDEQGPSTCYDDCAANWPPLLTDGEPTAGAGADDALLGTTERDDGAVQVTYDGWPLYRWAADAAPGDTTGQGVGDIWWVLGPDGTPLRDGAAQAPAAGEPEVADSRY